MSSTPPNHPRNILQQPPGYPQYYFFYGTLTTPQTLQRILDHTEEPTLRKAQITGFTVAKWGDYPTLINREQNDEQEQEQVISGYAYLVQSDEEAQKLASYETKAYMVTSCWICFVDGEEPGEVRGRTFMYAGDAKALLEQRFDRKLWALQMGGKLG
ncbi:hypothetical protein ASPWEDRAFT_30162 [Aspergillus wentii DTO 134E9]|uniref:Putative gamma-glutamylcyclotransferase n=1 Tax=Aspergillus wentii DTO 134E9 TaxID=1073089 RepID=A0A1L9RDN0_ASPWE|nr:uncharacterized protein ASPWEDRAFT_30162 [Aspergillus wentii DTO 134E9]KAI9933318.1 hypothetical protein MW887_007791 [Aspergillus wentii]OJJ33049.1 hypothetical protein ASPWEDRAFT_30162 [Aspergillus wentii DTO 134E9]